MHTLVKSFKRQEGSIIKCTDEAIIQLKLAYQVYYKAKPNASVARHKFLDDLATAKAEVSGKDVAGIYLQLRHREEQRRIGRRLRAVKQNTNRKYVTEVMAPGDDGTLQKYHTKEDIETQLCQESIRRFSQANHTACMQPEQVSLLGEFADSAISDSILQGTCPPNTPLHPGLRTLLPYLKTPETVSQAGAASTCRSASRRIFKDGKSNAKTLRQADPCTSDTSRHQLLIQPWLILIGCF